MEVTYPIDWVLEIYEELRLAAVSRTGTSINFKRDGIGRRVPMPVMTHIPEHALIDNMDAAGILEEYYIARDKVLARHTS
jgi:hypothetical protein